MDEASQPKWMRSTKGAPFTGIGSLEADILAVVWEQDRDHRPRKSTRRCASGGRSPTRP